MPTSPTERSGDPTSRVAREQYGADCGERVDGRIGHCELGREVICPRCVSAMRDYFAK